MGKKSRRNKSKRKHPTKSEKVSLAGDTDEELFVKNVLRGVLGLELQGKCLGGFVQVAFCKHCGRQFSDQSKGRVDKLLRLHYKASHGIDTASDIHIRKIEAQAR